MATDPFDDSRWLHPQPSSATSTSLSPPAQQMEDITSASYIPRMARMIPHSTTVHTIFIKKITYPMTSRPDELWILERTTDGRETWRPVETFLENLQLSQDPTTLRTTANQWRHYYNVPTISSSTSMASLFPVLPHPEHTNVHFGSFWTTGLRHPRSYLHITILLGTFCSTSLTRPSYIALLATLAFYTTVFATRTHSQNLDSFYDAGTYFLFTWTATTRSTWPYGYVRLECIVTSTSARDNTKDPPGH